MDVLLVRVIADDLEIFQERISAWLAEPAVMEVVAVAPARLLEIVPLPLRP